MNRKEVTKLDIGLYEVYWKSGGKSLAAVGITENGDRWLAPTNWINISSDTAKYYTWRMVGRVEKLKLRRVKNG